MKKTILLLAMWLVTVFCICYGTYKHLGGFKSVFKDGGIHITFDDDADYNAYDAEKDESGKYTIDENLEEFSSIKIDAAVMGLTIEQGNSFKIESTFNKEYLRPEFSVKGNKLTLSQPKRKQHGINAGSQNCRVVITIPSGTHLTNIDIDSNVGDVKLRKLDAEDIDIDLNVGEISVREVKFDHIDCNTNVGEVSIYPEDDIDDYSLSLSTDVGEVRVDGHSYKKSYNSKGKTGKKIKADTNVGEIKIK